MKLDRYEIAASGCWLWTGPINNKGYGRTGKRYAHREAFEAINGPIPIGMQIDHLCRTRSCVNPDHLAVVEPAENQRRSPLVTRLSDDDVRAIRESSESTYALGRIYGIHPSYVSRIKTRKKRASVE